MSQLRSSARLRLGALFAVLTATAATLAVSSPAPAADGPSIAAITFADEFNGPAGSRVDGSKWVTETGNNGGNNHEWQWYTNSANNAAMDGAGNLVITARRENIGQQCWNGPCQYTSARINTSGRFTQTYGHFEARMQLPRGQGIWPAFWMLGNNIGSVGWPTSGEIDIMENIGREPNTVHGTLHGPGYSGAEGIGAGRNNGDAYANGFHVFAIDWAPNVIHWSVDGIRYQTRTPADLGGDRWVFDHPFFIILNLAVGGDWPGPPNSGTVMPQRLVIDYVRVNNDSTGVPPVGNRITGIGGKCVDVAGANTANGTAVQLWDCNGTGAQNWTVGGDGTIRALGKCLDVSGGSTADGALVQLWDCNGTGAQRWTTNAARDIVNTQANKCLEATNSGTANGTRLRTWTCSGAANQKWSIG
jgi:beta-glucanase (GH16 family)